ncbi:hypothetical protein HDU67_003125 [Dinochytrium kinnereticum]|nr:hypothetical protein HDU67_003125 [Dinochytrium kinnereticum]
MTLNERAHSREKKDEISDSKWTPFPTASVPFARYTGIGELFMKAPGSPPSETRNFRARGSLWTSVLILQLIILFVISQLILTAAYIGSRRIEHIVSFPSESSLSPTITPPTEVILPSSRTKLGVPSCTHRLRPKPLEKPAPLTAGDPVNTLTLAAATPFSKVEASLSGRYDMYEMAVTETTTSSISTEDTRVANGLSARGTVGANQEDVRESVTIAFPRVVSKMTMSRSDPPTPSSVTTDRTPEINDLTDPGGIGDHKSTAFLIPFIARFLTLADDGGSGDLFIAFFENMVSKMTLLGFRQNYSTTRAISTSATPETTGSYARGSIGTDETGALFVSGLIYLFLFNLE